MADYLLTNPTPNVSPDNNLKVQVCFLNYSLFNSGFKRAHLSNLFTAARDDFVTSYLVIKLLFYQA